MSFFSPSHSRRTVLYQRREEEESKPMFVRMHRCYSGWVRVGEVVVRGGADRRDSPIEVLPIQMDDGSRWETYDISSLN